MLTLERTMNFSNYTNLSNVFNSQDIMSALHHVSLFMDGTWLLAGP